ncbi:MAG: asparagine synthase (glutamine-hydrolyzing) [Verrucomicrobiae bacterium]|nr:asparagine synthase (glutamine-hydrolyzing) [Verrucomicrobiae bacterium]
MCGIAGAILKSPLSPEQLRRMSDALRVRGPDAEGFWSHDPDGIALAHRRLSILDLSPAGAQPMLSANGRWVMAFNGEIYNFQELRADLEKSGHVFRGHSDTEVILEHCAVRGIEKTLHAMAGMFAIALWDRQEKELHLLRDRLGIKPLYWANLPQGVVFASELKSLTTLECFPRDMDHTALVTYFQYAYIPAPLTIYKAASKVLPGQWCRIKNFQVSCETYWDATDTFAKQSANPFAGSFDEASQELERRLSQYTLEHMVADVPLGAFLSGGIDSSTVVALAQAQNARPVKTFSIGFEEEGYSEAHFAEAVARHLKTDHVTEFCTGAQAAELVDRMPDMYDEPFADSSAIPTFLVSQMARKHVTVSLSGDGGDELFGGYNRYLMAGKMESLRRRLGPLAPLARSLLQLPPPRFYDSLLRLAVRNRYVEPGVKIHKLARMLGRDSEDYFFSAIRNFQADANPVRCAPLPLPLPITPEGTAFTRRMMLHDVRHYMNDDILTKVDRASMAVSLEARVPILDHRLVEWSWALPMGYLIQGSKGKCLLRSVLDRHVPRTLIDRPKMGFGIPVHDWFRGIFREKFQDAREATQKALPGLLDYRALDQIWAEHQSGRFSHGHKLWTYHMFFLWHAAHFR